MNPMLQQFLITIFRAGLLWLSGWLVKAGIFKEDEIGNYVAAAAIGLVTLTWALWSRYKSRLTFLAALQAPPGTTEQEVKEIVKQQTPNSKIQNPNNP